MSKEWTTGLARRVAACRLCPRLVAWRESVAEEKVARFRGDDYWGKPVPGFGDPAATMLCVGLAPAAHGGNRTGRIFTGDRSGDWLYRALWKAGFASSPNSISRNDGMKLMGCYITAAVRCAPPANKPEREEIDTCRRWLLEELNLLGRVRVVVALGKTGFDASIDSFRKLGMTAMKNRPAFGHGREYALNDRQTIIASFHPSQQNTFTGKLTEPMFDAVFARARKLSGG
jgi:uracil-DNA glycosylase